MRIVAVNIRGSGGHWVPSSPSVDVTEDGGAWKDLLGKVTSGELVVPSVKDSSCGRRLSRELLGLKENISFKDWQLVVSGILSTSVAGEHRDGLYRTALERAGYIRGIRSHIPSMIGASLAQARSRIFGAFAEGVLYALLLWDPTVGKGVPGLIAHCLFWAQQYADHEALLIRGEEGGLLREAELSLRASLGGSYGRVRLLAWAYGEAKACYGYDPTVEQILAILKEKKSKISVKQIEDYLTGRYRCVPIDLPTDLVADVQSLDKVAKRDVAQLSSSIRNLSESVGAMQSLAQLRDQLLTALTVVDDVGFHLSADVAEVLDVLLFRSLRFDDTTYWQREEVVLSLLIGKTLDDCKENQLAFLSWRQEIEKRATLLEKSSVCVDLVVRVPSPMAVAPKAGVLARVAPPLNGEGEEDVKQVAHIGGFKPRFFAHRVALLVAMRRAIRQGLATSYLSVSSADFKDALQEVKRVRKALAAQGYLQASSDKALPVVRELGMLDAGFFPVVARTVDGEQIDVICGDGVARPMMLWEAPKHHMRNGGQNPVCRASAVDVGLAIEELREAKRLSARERNLLCAGRLEYRDVYVREPTNPDVVLEREKKTRHGNMVVVRGYRLVSRLLPAMKLRSKLQSPLASC